MKGKRPSKNAEVRKTLVLPAVGTYRIEARTQVVSTSYGSQTQPVTLTLGSIRHRPATERRER